MNTFNRLEKEVVKKELCHQCGSCVGACPVNCIEIKGFAGSPVLTGKCIDCGLCYEVCPGKGMDREKAYEHMKETSNTEFGLVKKTYLVRSKDNTVIKNAASGGAITSILLYLLDKKVVNQVALASMNKDKPWEPELLLAKTSEDIRRSSQSKYTLLSMNSLLAKIKPNESYAFVGLPCHINGIKNMDMYAPNKTKNCKLTIGIFCGANTNFGATEFLYKKMGVKKEDTAKMEYRGGKWPGGFLVTLKNGEQKFFHKFYHNVVIPPFMDNRCMLCPDFYNEFADIAVGDAWLPELIKKQDPWSLILVRTKRGLETITKAEKAGFIETKEITMSDVMRAQKHQLKIKVQGGLSKIRFAKLFGRPTPTYDFPNIKTSLFKGLALTVIVKKAHLFRPIFYITPIKWWGKLAEIARKIVVGK
ncbi:MAG: Coenzyme F420 hydrogenase/dehydrogenase, beta subunit C-terminal domain [Nanoarchaeota archaeon]